MFELMKGIRSTLEAYKAVKPQERVLVIADNEGSSIWVGQLFMNAANSMGAEAVLTVIPPPEERELGGEEPPASVAAAMKSVNAIFRTSDGAPLVHTNAREEATAAGVRYYVVHPSLVDELKQGVSTADLRLIKKRTENLARRLTQANVAKVTTPSGTNITMGLTDRQGIAPHPLSPIIGNFDYYAEAAIAPVEGTAEGIMVADLAFVQWGHLLRQPLRCTVKAGKVVNISGSKQDADRLRKIIATDENASNIAELGIGTSHIVPLPMLGTRRDAARIGTAHIAIGRNRDIGGKTWSRIHQDGIMEQVTLELDGQCVLRDGAFLI